MGNLRRPKCTAESKRKRRSVLSYPLPVRVGRNESFSTWLAGQVKRSCQPFVKLGVAVAEGDDTPHVVEGAQIIYPRRLTYGGRESCVRLRKTG